MATETAEFKAKIKTEADLKGVRDLKRELKFLKDLEARMNKVASRDFIRASRKSNLARLDPQFHEGRHRLSMATRAADNAARRKLGMPELPSLMKQRPSFTRNMLQGLGMGGASAGFVGELLTAAPAIAGIAAGVFAVKQAFDAVVFSVKTVTTAVFELTKHLAASTFHALDFTQRMELGFGALLKGKHGDPVGVFNAVRHEAQNLGLDVEDTTESYRKLLAAQFSVGQATELTRSMADLQAAGASQSDIQHALLAISQIKMKDKLQAEELTRQLANAGVSSELVYKHLQKRMGIAPGKEGFQKVQAMQQAGQINASMAIPAIIAAIAEKTGSATPGEFALKKAQARVSGMLAQMKGMVTNAFIDVAQHIATPVTESFATIFNGIKRISQSPEIVALKKAFGDVFIATAEFLAKQWPTIEPIVMGVINTLTQAFGNITEYIRNNGETIADKIKTIATAGIAVGIVMFNVTKTVYGLADSILSMVAALDRAGPYIEMALKIGGAVVGTVGAPFGAGGVGAGLYAAGSAIGSIGEAVGSAKGIMATSSPELRSLQEFGFSGNRFEQEEASAYNSPGIASMFENVPKKNPLDALGGQPPFWKQNTFGDVNVKVESLDLSDPDAAGAAIGQIVRREVNKTLDDN